MTLRDINHILSVSVARSMMQLYHIVVQVCYGTFSEKDDALKCYLVNYIFVLLLVIIEALPYLAWLSYLKFLLLEG